MAISLNGTTGVISGITDLPNAIIDTDMLAAGAVTEAKLGAGAVTESKLGSDQQQGLAKAWVNFNGTGTVAIRASFNVSSITDNATGNYTVNFTNPMVDTNFAYTCSVGDGNHSSNTRTLSYISSTTSTLQILAENTVASNIDEPQVCIAIFR